MEKIDDYTVMINNSKITIAYLKAQKVAIETQKQQQMDLVELQRPDNLAKIEAQRLQQVQDAEDNATKQIADIDIKKQKNMDKRDAEIATIDNYLAEMAELGIKEE